MSKPIAEAKFYAMTAEAAVKTLQSDAGRGLSGSEAKKRLGVYGENRLQKGKKTSFAKKFMLQFGDFMVLILLIASAVSFAVSCMQGEANLADPLLILGIVIANAFVGTVQEAKAERALEALRTLSAPHADVLRDGKRAVISAEALVPGDVVYIRAGDVVPADLRLLESVHLQAEESALTGESVPSGKSANAVCDETCGAAERKNMLFSGTGISAGQGVGIVTATGMQTEMGRIAAMLGDEETPDTPLKLRLRRTGKLIGLLVLGICAVIFIIGLIQKVDPLEMFMISISLAVAAIPEGLPAVVTIVLALGVRRMAAKRAIIRHLPAVETLGSCEVICSDKTGTLTQNKMTVVRCAGAAGELNGQDRDALLSAAALSAKNRDMANDALRVLAAAEKRTEACPETDDAAESGLCFLGLIGLEDPPRPEAAEAVSECKRAGIRPVMITGDQPATASAIAGRLGIENKAVMTGAELESLSDDALLQTVQTCSVYARVSPAHKMRIIKAFRRLKLVTAMTGDGVNDAPALKAADIGCAMGKNGTEVAKNAADMVLTDDNFATIVSAVREGRTVYGNIRKTIHFLMSCNIGEILVVLVSFLLRTPTPLLPAQLLWVNLVTDSLPALALGSDPPQGDVMRRPPTARDSSAFSNGLGFAMAAEGMMIGALALLAFTVGRVFFDADPMQPAVGRTMAFAVLSLSQLVHSYNMRSTGPVLGRGMFKNRGLNVSFLICSAWMAGVVVFPQAAALFGSVSLTLTQWGIVAILALLPLPICEMQKRILSRTAKVKNMTSGAKKRVIFNK